MSDQALKAAWQYFRMMVGAVLVMSFIFMMLTRPDEGQILERLLTLLFGVMQFGSGFINVKTNGHGSG